VRTTLLASSAARATASADVEVGAGAEVDGRIRVSELAADEDDVEAVGDQQGGVGVAEGVE
jgi:hypothetical protein